MRKKGFYNSLIFARKYLGVKGCERHIWSWIGVNVKRLFLSNFGFYIEDNQADTTCLKELKKAQEY